MSLYSQLAGIMGAVFQLGGTSGNKLKNNGSGIDARNSADSAYVNVRGLDPVIDNDLTTKQYVDKLASRYICTAQISGATALPSNTATEHFIVVTTTGGTGTIGQVYWDDGLGAGNVTIITLTSGALVATPTALTGGTISFSADSLYIWDGTAYHNVAGSQITGAVQCITFTVTHATTNSVTAIPAGATVLTCRVDVTTPFSAGGTLSVGQTGSVSLLMTTAQSDPLTANGYINEQLTPWGASSLTVLATVGGAPAAGVATVTVLYSNANN